MKRSYRNLLAVGILSVSVVFAACQREFGGGGEQSDGQAGFEIAEAKQFFEQKYTELSSEIVTLQGFVKSMFDPGEFTPMWDKAREWGDGHTGYIAIPFIADYTYEGSFTVDPSAEKPERYMTTVFQRLLIGNGSGEMEGHIVSIVPSRDYYQMHGLASGDRFAPVGSDFDGIVFYTSLNCVDIVRLEKYSRGKLMHSIDPNLSSQHPAKRYENIYKLAGQFGVSRSQKVGSRSSEYNPNGGSSFMNNVPYTWNVQIYGDYNCLQGTMGIASAMLGDPSRDINYYSRQYWTNYHISSITLGTNPEDYLPFMRDHFNISSVNSNSVSLAIDAGYPIVGRYASGSMDHVVLIYGCDGNGQVYYADPYGFMGSMHVSYMIDLYALTSHKY